jgi:hypothetical protein
MRKTLREMYAETQKSLDTLSALTGKPRILVPVLPPKRTVRKPSNPASEAQIQKAILAALQIHPAVALIYRVNSGTFAQTNRNGSKRYIRANSQRGMTDLCGTMKNGRSIYIEVKSATGKVQPHQAFFIEQARNAGAIAGIARSVEDALFLIEKG